MGISELLIAEALHVRGLNPRASVPLLDRVLALISRVLAVLGRADLFNDAGLRQSSLATLEKAVERNPWSVSLLRAYAQQLRAVDRTTDAEEVEDRYLSVPLRRRVVHSRSYRGSGSSS
ncbi:MAG: hypothetical protein U0165_01740 [Polyangiaceae bacterium]